jgi:hypothetical protein
MGLWIFALKFSIMKACRKAFWFFGKKWETKLFHSKSRRSVIFGKTGLAWGEE